MITVMFQTPTEEYYTIKRPWYRTPVRDILYKLGIINEPKKYEMVIVTAGIMRLARLSPQELGTYPITMFYAKLPNGCKVVEKEREIKSE